MCTGTRVNEQSCFSGSAFPGMARDDLVSELGPIWNSHSELIDLKSLV